MYVRRSELVTTEGFKAELVVIFLNQYVIFTLDMYLEIKLELSYLNYPICYLIENVDGNVTPGNVKQIPLRSMY
jgi:hypothetical protein